MQNIINSILHYKHDCFTKLIEIRITISESQWKLLDCQYLDTITLRQTT